MRNLPEGERSAQSSCHTDSHVLHHSPETEHQPQDKQRQIERNKEKEDAFIKFISLKERPARENREREQQQR